MSDEEGMSVKSFQIAVAAAGVLVTALLGFGQWQLSHQQNLMIQEQRKAEEKRASETMQADKVKAADNIEVQVMAVVAPYLAKLRGSDKEAENSQKVVVAAAEYLTSRYQRTALAEMSARILGNSNVKPDVQTRIAEATEPGVEGSKSYAVIASLAALSAADLVEAKKIANEKLKLAAGEGLSQGVQLYKTRVSNHYAVVIGGPMTRSDALNLAALAREKRLASDAYAQQDRSWIFIGNAPFK